MRAHASCCRSRDMTIMPGGTRRSGRAVPGAAVAKQRAMPSREQGSRRFVVLAHGSLDNDLIPRRVDGVLEQHGRVDRVPVVGSKDDVGALGFGGRRKADALDDKPEH